MRAAPFGLMTATTIGLVACAPAPAPIAPPATSAALEAPCSTESRQHVWACIHDSPRRAQARACYDDARRTEPDLAGHLIVAWTINDQGVVQTVRFDEDNSSIRSAAVRACVTKIFLQTRWNTGTAGHVRTGMYDFQFHPR